LEVRLGEALRSAANWKAVLVLDDANPFLHDDPLSDPRLTALSSAFRFQLARSDALVFMTAVVGSKSPRLPDKQFLSHISVALRLEGFSSNPAFQSDIWTRAIRSLGGQHRPQSELAIVNDVLKSELAQHMDGRQIHACVRAALALAKQSRSSINASHIHEVIGLADDFRKSFDSPPRRGPVHNVTVDRQSRGQMVQ
jgi:hypothetical protein